MPDPASHPLRVFLSHASQDKPAVRDLCKRLAAEGWIDPWLDEEKLSLGQHWTTAIEEALDGSDVIIIFLSKNSVQKEGFIQRELNYAWELSWEKPRNLVFLIPFRLDDCEIPRYLRFRQCGDYFGERKEATYRNLLRTLRDRYQQKLQLEAQGEVRDEQLIHEPAETTEDIANLEGKAKTSSPALKPVQFVSDPHENKGKFTPGGVPIYTFGGIEFVNVPAGKFLMGSRNQDKQAYDDEKPQHNVDIPYDFYIGRFPVTNAQYAAYVKAKSIKHPVSGWETKRGHPVVSVSWNDAMAYCQWLNELPEGLFFRLPSEAEWEKAARGEFGFEWSWGNQFDKSNCNSYEGGKGRTTPIGAYSPAGDSPYGAADMVGNVWEWTQSLFRSYPYSAKDGRENLEAEGERVVRGGSFRNIYWGVRCAYRNKRAAGDCLSLLGFRVAIIPKP